MALSQQQQKVHSAMAAVSSALWFFAFIFIVIVFLNFMSRRKLYELKSKVSLHLATSIFILTIIASINFIYSRFCNSLQNSGFNLSDDIIIIGNMLGNSFVIITYALIASTFVLRLKYVFAGTKYDYPSWFYIFMYCEIVLMLIASFTGELLDVTAIKGIALVLLIFNCILLTYLFYRSLKNIMNSTVHEHLITIMVKYVVLVSLCMSTSFIFGIGVVFEGIFNDTDMEEPFTYFVWIIQTIDAPINISAIYFQFKFADDHYFKFLSKYHDWVGTTFFDAPTHREVHVGTEMSADTTAAVETVSGTSMTTAVETTVTAAPVR